MPAAIEARGLTKDYGDLVALAPLDLDVPAGQTVALLGHNGSGKTTLLRMAAGLLEPTGGEVRVAGHPAGSLGARAAAAYLPDTPVLYDDLSVAEHLEYVARLHDTADWEGWADDLLGRLGLAARADDLPARFSRGLRQKTAIALAFVRPFDLLLVDEPFVGLDAPGRAALLALLDEVSAEGATVVVSTHALDFVSRVERVVALRDGALAYDGPARTADVERLVG